VSLHLGKEAGETRLDWEGSTPSCRILRSESNDFANPTVLEDAWLDKYYVDFGTLTDGRNYDYSVE
jgi:hypothetical protein